MAVQDVGLAARAQQELERRLAEEVEANLRDELCVAEVMSDGLSRTAPWAIAAAPWA